MSRGRKAKPPALKLIEGNPGKRAIEGDIPKPEAIEIAPPRWLSKEGKEEYRRLMPELVRWGLFGKLDMVTLATYCEAFATYRRALVQVKRAPTYTTVGKFGTMHRARPEVAIMNEAMRQMIRYGSEFGLSPSARVQLKGTSQGDLFDTPEDNGGVATSGWDAL